MKKLIGFLAVLLWVSIPAFAQHGSHGVGGGGHIPAHGPAPAKVGRPAPAPSPHGYSDKAGHPNAPHVHSNGKWIGHDSGPNDAHYHIDHP
jgi:hypothetical protein